MPLTDRETLAAGEVVKAGRRSAYRALAKGAGEDHVVRADLLGADRAAMPSGGRRPIACIAHMTDLHVGDVQSPARFEFLNREYGDPRFAELVPVQRPQEALTPHALSALTSTLNGGWRARSPAPPWSWSSPGATRSTTGSTTRSATSSGCWTAGW